MEIRTCLSNGSSHKKIPSYIPRLTFFFFFKELGLGNDDVSLGLDSGGVVNALPFLLAVLQVQSLHPGLNTGGRAVRHRPGTRRPGGLSLS